MSITSGGGFEGSGLVPNIPRGTVSNNGGNPDWEESGDAFRGNYFFFHHTAADTMTTMDPDDMDLNTAICACAQTCRAAARPRLPLRPPVARMLLPPHSAASAPPPC